MVKSTKTSLKFANTEKRAQIASFIDEYQTVTQKFVDLIWNLERVPTFLDKEYTSQVETWLSARAVQCAGKQASGIVRGTRAKQEKRLFMINYFLEIGELKKAKELQKIYDETNISCPILKNVCPELDERFVKQDWDNPTSFDGFITLSSLGNKLKIKIPIKKHKHFNKLAKTGILLKGVRLSKKDISFNFEMPEIAKKQRGKIKGLDMGIKKTFICSDGQKPKPDNHGHTLDSVISKLSKKQKGSKAFKKLQDLRKNLIRQNINQLNLSSTKQINIEDLYNMRNGRYVSRQISHFTYTEIVDKLSDYCYENGVHLVKVPAFYTSQRCSVCGFVKKSNRKGETFECQACKFICDADLNASKNIQMNLPKPDGYVDKVTGFYWCKPKAKSIVSLPKT